MKFELKKYNFEEKGEELYINLGQTSDDLRKPLIVPKAWLSDGFIIFPQNKSTAHLRYEFFKNGRYHLRREEDITQIDLPRVL